jgi:hypothetical protein
MIQPEGVSGFTWKQDRFRKINEDKAYGGRDIAFLAGYTESRLKN